jgi:hypothetical protein
MRKWDQIEKALTPYATSADFCRIFHEEMDSLYLLSLLLTADYEQAEMCFVRSLVDSAEGTSVFKEWAHSWAQRTIIRNAVRLSDPRPTGGNSVLNPASRHLAANMQAEIAAVINLPAFERFVFILGVFERFSDQDCSLLLSCTRVEVITARTRALRRIANLRKIEQEEIPVANTHEDGLGETCNCYRFLDLFAIGSSEDLPDAQGANRRQAPNRDRRQH